jgi:capsid protein
MIDPLKEVNAARAMLSGGIKSPQEIAREMGFDYDDTMQEFAEADKMRDKLGVRVDTDARFVLQKAAPMVDNSTSSGE